MAALADAHLHLFSPGFSERYDEGWASTDELARYEAFRAVHGIERGLVAGMELGPFKGNNDHLAELAAGNPWMAPLAFVPVDPGRTELAGRWEQGFAGVSLYAVEPGDGERLGAWPDDLVAELNGHRAVVSVNALPGVSAGLERFVDRADGCTVLFSHLGLPGAVRVAPPPAEAAERLAHVLRLAGRPHVGVKLSALYAATDPPHAWPHEPARPFVRALLERFGPERLYWGSDASPALQFVSFDQTVDVLGGLGLTRQEAGAVLGGNLLRVLDAR
jgi:predicted TIM-barrel fold metal-dependent hydrolase